jgi:hypothetical protein
MKFGAKGLGRGLKNMYNEKSPFYIHLIFFWGGGGESGSGLLSVVGRLE